MAFSLKRTEFLFDWNCKTLGQEVKHHKMFKKLLKLANPCLFDLKLKPSVVDTAAIEKSEHDSFYVPLKITVIIRKTVNYY